MNPDRDGGDARASRGSAGDTAGGRDSWGRWHSRRRRRVDGSAGRAEFGTPAAPGQPMARVVGGCLPTDVALEGTRIGSVHGYSVGSTAPTLLVGASGGAHARIPYVPLAGFRESAQKSRRPTVKPQVAPCGPRARGDGPQIRDFLADCTGWSPRTRGWSPDPRLPGRLHWVVPAHAGMVPRCADRRPVELRGPRARGDGPGGKRIDLEKARWSPRTRGWSDAPAEQAVLADVVPAHAGLSPGLMAIRPVRLRPASCFGRRRGVSLCLKTLPLVGGASAPSWRTPGIRRMAVGHCPGIRLSIHKMFHARDESSQ